MEGVSGFAGRSSTTGIRLLRVLSRAGCANAGWVSRKCDYPKLTSVKRESQYKVRLSRRDESQNAVFDKELAESFCCLYALPDCC